MNICAVNHDKQKESLHSFIAEQGHWMKRPAQISVEVVGPRDAIETVKIGGSAVVVLQGDLLL